MNYQVKNQNKIKAWHLTDCSLYTLFTISELTFMLKISYGFIEKVSKIAVIDKVLLKLWAYFPVIYNWFTKKTNKELWINTKVIKENVDSKRFQELVDKWFYFWIWLKHGNKAYKKAIKRWKLTKKDIDQIIKEKWWFWHNNCFGLSRNLKSTYSIFEIYTWQEIECDIDVLIYGAKRGVLYYPGRTIWANDDFTWEVMKKLRSFKKWPYSWDEVLDKALEIKFRFE